MHTRRVTHSVKGVKKNLTEAVHMQLQGDAMHTQMVNMQRNLVATGRTNEGHTTKTLST